MVKRESEHRPKEVLGEVLKWTGLIVGGIGLLNGNLSRIALGALVGVSGVLIEKGD